MEIDSRLKIFKNFLFLVWKHLGLPKPTRAQYALADVLQYGDRRMVMEAFRGVGKSYITSAFVVWCLLMNPQMKIMVVSASKLRADDFSTFTMRLILEMPILPHLRPGKDQRNSKIAFDVGPATASHSPSVKSVGITGQLAGSRADLIVADDIEVPNNSMTQAMRDKLSEAVKEFDAVLKPDGRIIYLGTPQTEMSLYNQLPGRGYTMIIWPARYPKQNQLVAYGNALHPKVTEDLEKDPSLEWQPTDPERFDDFDLEERALSYGRTGFSLQFQLDTSLSDADKYPLKLSDLIVTDLTGGEAYERYMWMSDPRHALTDLPLVGMQGDKYYAAADTIGELVPYQGTVMSIDPSGRGSDELSYAIVSIINSQLFVRQCAGLQGGYSDYNLQYLAETAKIHGVNEVVIESNFGDGMFTKLITPHFRETHPVTIEEVRHSKQKELRIIDTLEPVMNQHRLIVDQRIIKEDFESVKDYPPEQQAHYMLFHQLTRITKARGALKHDDRLDALAIAVAYWVERMATDHESAMADRRQELIEEELERTREAVENGLAMVFGHLGEGSNSGGSIL